MQDWASALGPVLGRLLQAPPPIPAQACRLAEAVVALCPAAASQFVMVSAIEMRVMQQSFWFVLSVLHRVNWCLWRWCASHVVCVGGATDCRAARSKLCLALFGYVIN